jgi:hypothetical protein
MPIRITPKDGESKESFIRRCAGDSQINKEFPKQSQKLGVCFSIWREAHPHSKADLKDIDVIKIGTDFFLF